MKKYLLISFLLIIGLLLSACSSSNLSDGINDGTGSLAISLVDIPVNDVKEVWVAIESVQVKRVDYDWETIKEFASGEGEFNLLALKFDSELLGEKPLPSGHYTQIRLIGEKNGRSEIVYKDGVDPGPINLKIPSIENSGLKINHDFIIEEGVIKHLILDANVSKIMHQAGKSGMIILEPTAISVIDEVVSGSIEGRVTAATDEDGVYEPITNSDVLIEALDTEGNPVLDQNGNPIKTVASVEEDLDTGKPAGSFVLRGLLKGTYNIKASVLDNETSELDDSIYQVTTEENVVVTAGQITERDIKLERTVTTGSIEGNIVADNDGAYEAITTSDVVVKAIQNETVISTVTAPANDLNSVNHFKLSNLEEGTYSLKVYVADSNGDIDETTYVQTTLENISVTAGSTNLLADDIILERVIEEQPK